MFDGYIRDNAFWRPRATAVLTPARAVSYAQFDADIDRVGTGLAALGLARGCGVVSIRIEDAYLHRVALAALSRLGIASSPAEDEEAEFNLAYVTGEPGFHGPDLTFDRSWAEAALAAPHVPLPRLEPEPQTLVRVMLSSGTTSKPKRIGFTWQRLEATTLTNIRVYGPGRMGVCVPLTGADSLLGFGVGVTAWALGAAYGSGLFIEHLPGVMERDAQGIVVMTPIQLRNLLKSLPPGFAPKPGWRLQVGGSALPADLAVEAELRITPDVWHGYGATESSRITAAPAARLRDTPGAVGVVPASASVQIVDEAGQPLPDGASGELVVKGTRTAEGYLGDPETTAERFRDGWYHTNDLARRLPNGTIVIEGRLDDRMNLGGRKFMPQAMEAAAMACPGVLDCACFAVPDDKGLDQCWLAVVADPGLDRAALASQLSGENLPERRFAWIDEIPRNAMGKVERATLREATLAVLRSGSG